MHATQLLLLGLLNVLMILAAPSSSHSRPRRSIDSFTGRGYTGLDKRAFDTFAGSGALDPFDKRAFDTFASSFGGFDKRAFDSMAGNGFLAFDKRAFDSLAGSGFEAFDKRAAH